MITNNKALAMLDRATEDALYAHFGAYFRRAEEERRWNLWGDVPWDQAKPAPGDDLVQAVEAAYAQELFLPDYSAKLIHLLRSSRGRAWFLTRWTYEEGKHLLALGEWLMRSGARTNDELESFSDRVLAQDEWQLASPDPTTALAQVLAREHEEVARYQKLLVRAETAGDGALVAVITKLLGDEQAHRHFFRDALRLIEERHPILVQTAASTLAGLFAAEPFVPGLLSDLKASH